MFDIGLLEGVNLRIYTYVVPWLRAYGRFKVRGSKDAKGKVEFERNGVGVVKRGSCA